MRADVLPRADYARLAGTELESVVPFLPRDSRVVIVEHHDELVGCWALVPYLHVEGLWVHPDHRTRGVVGRHLYDRMCHEATLSGECVVLTAALTEDVATLIVKAGGQQLPGAHFVLPIGKR